MRSRERKLNRMRGYDYSMAGYYFVTIKIRLALKMFGKIHNGKIILNQFGKIAKKYWLNIPIHFPGIFIDKFVVMPDHVHGIIIITKKFDGEKNNNDDKYVGNGDRRSLRIKTIPQMNSSSLFLNRKFSGKNIGLSKIINQYKSSVTRVINHKYPTIFRWQKSFYDHIIRNEMDLNRIRNYIEENPIIWEFENNPPPDCNNV